jgi:hypothetical protein
VSMQLPRHSWSELPPLRLSLVYVYALSLSKCLACVSEQRSTPSECEGSSLYPAPNP